MVGLRFDFEENDLILDGLGRFVEDVIDSQCAALIAKSQICRLTKPSVGVQIMSRLQNKRAAALPSILAIAIIAVKKDGARSCTMPLNPETGEIDFNAVYDA